MARVLPPRFCSWNNSSHFSSTFHDLPQPQPKICHKLACDLKTLILHGHRIIDGDLLHTTVSDHTYKKEHIHIGTSCNISKKTFHNRSIYSLCEVGMFVLNSYCFGQVTEDDDDLTKQVFAFSPLGACHLLHIYLNWLNTCMLEENKSFLHSIQLMHDPSFVLFSTAKNNSIDRY